MSSASAPSLAVIIVTYNSAEALAATLPALKQEALDGDEIFIVDNASQDESVLLAGELMPTAGVIETGVNGGFGAGCNRGAAEASADLLCFLNPDAVPQPGWRDAIVAPVSDDRDWAAWQALVTADDGRLINSNGGVLHFTGIAWAGDAGKPGPVGRGGESGVPPADTSTSPPALRVEPDAGHEEVEEGGAPGSSPTLPEPGFASGACLVMRRDLFATLGGFSEPFFLYHEDVDLSLRVRLAGGRLGVAADAVVDHDYEFDKGAAKWRYLERNRWATIIRTYPGSLLLLLAPALLATEVALVAVSIRGGWFRQKLLAWGDSLRSLPRWLRERRSIRLTQAVSAAEFAKSLTPDLDSAYLGGASRSRLLRTCLRGYWRLVRSCLHG